MHLLTLGTQPPKKFINLISEHKINQNFRPNSVFEFYQISARLEHKKSFISSIWLASLALLEIETF